MELQMQTAISEKLNEAGVPVSFHNMSLKDYGPSGHRAYELVQSDDFEDNMRAGLCGVIKTPHLFEGDAALIGICRSAVRRNVPCKLVATSNLVRMIDRDEAHFLENHTLFVRWAFDTEWPDFPFGLDARTRTEHFLMTHMDNGFGLFVCVAEGADLSVVYGRYFVQRLESLPIL